MTWNESSPDLTAQVLFRRRWEAGWTAFTDYSKLSISRVWDAAPMLHMDVMNADGEYSEFWQPGTRIRVKAGLGSLYPYPLFEGFIPPGTGLELDAAVHDPTIGILAVGYLGQLARETTFLGTYVDQAGVTRTNSYSGLEAGVAIRDVIDSLANLTYDSSAPLDTTGIRGTSNPSTFIDADNDVPAGIYTKKAIVDYYLGLAFNDQDESDVALPYHLLETPRPPSDTPGVRMFKEPNPETATAYRTIDFTTDVIGFQSQSQFEQISRCLVRSSKDPTLWHEHVDHEAENRFGRNAKSITLATTDRSVLARRAWAEVQARKLPQLAYRVDLLDGWWAYPGMVIALSNTRFGSRGNQLVTKVDHEIGQDTVRTTLYTRAKPEEAVA